MRYIFCLPLLFIISACSHPKPQYMAKYHCNNGMNISAIFHPENVSLVIDGIEKQLYQTVSASGAKYATENGLQPETGLIWWIKGNEATMFEMILDHTVTPDNYKEITVCKEK
jgi:membrane-bound inhibitor of C-type lysozyme